MSQRFFTLIFAMGLLTGLSIPVVAVTLYKPETINYVRNPEELKPSIFLEPQINQVQLTMPSKVIFDRTLKSASVETIPPLSVKIPTDPVKVHDLASDLAKPGMAGPLADLMLTALKDSSRENKTKRLLTQKFLVKPSFLNFVDTNKLGKFLSQPHLNLVINSRSWTGSENAALRQLAKQAKDFLDPKVYKSLLAKMSLGQGVSIDKDLLPRFAMEKVGDFNTVQGPNCFHASLAFQGIGLAKSPYVNLKEEKGYDLSMINYDELWRVLKTSFYEINSTNNRIQYGDIIVFFDTPDKTSPWVDFKTIRHASTYLFDRFTFSKGSKSPDSPYSVKTIADEWATWSRFSSRLGVKVYRRSEKRVRPVPPKDLAEWVY